MDVAAPAATPASAASDAGPPTQPADAGFRACDSQVNAAQEVQITDTGACPGVLPSAVTCAADLRICAGHVSGGSAGSMPLYATSDGRGSAVLSCRRLDVGPPVVNALFVPKPSGFVSTAQLGTDVRPLADGFVSSQGSYQLPPPEYDFLAHDGGFRTAQRGGMLYAGPDGAVILRVADGQLVADSYVADGTLKATVAIAALPAPASSLMLGGARSTSGATLLLWQVYGESNATARWLGANGTAASAPFSIAGWTEVAPATAALAGGAIAVAAQPPSGSSTPTWRGLIAPGATAETPPPSWLSSRGDFFLLPGGRAMAFGSLASEILTAEGTVCGTVQLSGPLLGIGVDGTAFSGRDDQTFRVYPQLFHE